MRPLHTLLVLTLILPTAACGDDDNGGPPPPTCQRRDESITQAIQAYEEIATDTWMAQPFDFMTCDSLMPNNMACSFTGNVIDFEEDEFQIQLAGTTVRVFLGNQIADAVAAGAAAGAAGCEANDYDAVTDANSATCLEGTADGSGQVVFPNLPCDETFAVWAHKFSAITPVSKPAVEFDHRARVGGSSSDVLTVSVKTFNLIPGIVGFSPDPSLGIVAGRAQDCTGNGVRYINTFIEGGRTTTPTNDTFCGDSAHNRVGTFYFVDNFPTKDQSGTSEDGLWSFVNVPVGPVTVYAYGRQTDNGTFQSVGSVQLSSLPDTITVADLRLDSF